MNNSNLDTQETAIKLNVVRTLLSSLPAVVTADRFMLDMLKTHHPEWTGFINAAHELLDSSVHAEKIEKIDEEEIDEEETDNSFSLSDFLCGLDEDDRKTFPYHLDIDMTITERVLAIFRAAKLKAVEAVFNELKATIRKVESEFRGES